MRARTDGGRRRTGRRSDAGASVVSSSERTKWNATHRGKPAGDPEPFVIEMLRLLPREGLALDVAAGRGRNALALARAAMRVIAADFSETAMRLLAEVARA